MTQHIRHPGRDTSNNAQSTVEQDVTNGAAHVGIRNTLNLQTYDADKTPAAATTSYRDPVPNGAQWLIVSNESTTVAEALRFRFGDSSVVATADTGYRVRAGNGTNYAPPEPMRIPVPADATHVAYYSESGTPTFNMIWE